MTEQLLVDLMGDLDISLLENDYMEHDMMQNQTVKKHRFVRSRAMKRGDEFALTDSLRNAVYEQRELIDNVIANPTDEESITDKIDIKVDAVKKKVNTAITIISGVAAAVVVAASVIVVLIRKKSLAKLFGKGIQTA